MTKLLTKIFSTFFGVGFIPLAPGTITSALIVLAYRFVLHPLSWPILGGLILLLFILGVWSAEAYSLVLNRSDPGRIVIDEACGQLLALLWVPADKFPLALSFLVFRLLDVIKPYPLRLLEKLPGGWGIMADDIGAGLVTLGVVHLTLRWI